MGKASCCDETPRADTASGCCGSVAVEGAAEAKVSSCECPHIIFKAPPGYPLATGEAQPSFQDLLRLCDCDCVECRCNKEVLTKVRLEW